jgi:hypothetical protein
VAGPGRGLAFFGVIESYFGLLFSPAGSAVRSFSDSATTLFDTSPRDSLQELAYKLVAKMGWAEGQGLGKDNHGISKHLWTKKRADVVGLGAEASNDWGAHSVQTNTYNSLLAKLDVIVNNSDDSDSASSSDEDSDDKKVRLVSAAEIVRVFPREWASEHASGHTLLVFFLFPTSPERGITFCRARRSRRRRRAARRRRRRRRRRARKRLRSRRRRPSRASLTAAATAIPTLRARRRAAARMLMHRGRLEGPTLLLL